MEETSFAARVANAMYERDRAAQALGIVVEESRFGYARCRMPVAEAMLNGHDICHGGYPFLLADTAFAYACNSRNDTNVAVVVQGSFIGLGGRVVNDRPKLVLPGKAVQVSLPGNKRITIRESRAPNRILFQDNVAAGTEDKFVLINPDPPLKVKCDQTTKKDFLTPKK